MYPDSVSTPSSDHGSIMTILAKISISLKSLQYPPIVIETLTAATTAMYSNRAGFIYMILLLQ